MDMEILEMINQYTEKGDFFGEISDENIVMIEKKLGCTFPPQYREFVKRFGSGGICGVEVLGVEGMEYASVVDDTERYRKLGLPENYLVIENVDEFVYCINTKGDYYVIRWDDISKEEIIRYSTFDEYLKGSFQEAIDNWD